MHGKITGTMKIRKNVTTMQSDRGSLTMPTASCLRARRYARPCARLDRKGRIALDGKPRIVFTSESENRIPYHLADEGIVPAGLPVVRPTTEKPLELEPADKGFHVVPRGQARDTVAITVHNPLGDRFEKDANENRPHELTSSVRVDGFFRGQEFSGTTAVSINPVPDTVAIGPPPSDPPDASIAVRASKEIIARFGEGTGSVAIVLDCSGSMMDPTAAGRTKFDEAQEALRQVLPLVPPKTKLSLWTFSQLPPGVNQIFPGDPLARGAGIEHQASLADGPLGPATNRWARWANQEASAFLGDAPRRGHVESRRTRISSPLRVSRLCLF